ncbi:RNA recognition motif protein [Toxoplasma gondii VAND]|uniref:RNA recognition motif protein n=1 Tax=Toxoplasma gondii VAND TaxID=933077 RepID=A0A086PV35_TOXGO|nr:RNA recognition motif protein [Toxoplasma gondii VAND]
MRATRKGRGAREDPSRHLGNSPSSPSLVSPTAANEDGSGKACSGAKKKVAPAAPAASAGAVPKGRRGSAEEAGSPGGPRDGDSKCESKGGGAKSGAKRSSSMSAREEAVGSASSSRRSASGERRGGARKGAKTEEKRPEKKKEEVRSQPTGGKGEKGAQREEENRGDDKAAKDRKKKKGPNETGSRKRASSTSDVSAMKSEEDAHRTTSEDESSPKKARPGRGSVATPASQRTESKRSRGREEPAETASRPASSNVAWGAAGSSRGTPVGVEEEREEAETCPLCLEDMDETDRGLFPCECGYQLCLWCLHHIRERLGNKCPACRREYDEKKFKFNEERVSEGKRLAARQRGRDKQASHQAQNLPLLPSSFSSLPPHASHSAATQASRTGASGSSSTSAWASPGHASLASPSTSSQASHAAATGSGTGGAGASGAKAASSNAERPGVGSPAAAAALKDVRVIQRSLVYVIGIPSSIAKKEILKRTEFFGQYGKVLHIVINKAQGYNSAWGGPSYAVYVTYSTVPEAIAAIQSIDGAVYEGRTLKASFGTTKYCSYFLKGIKCQNPDCFYLHYLGSDKDSFTKEAMISAKHQFLDLTLPTEETKKGSGASGSGPLASRSASPPAFGFPSVSPTDAAVGDRGAVKPFGLLSPGSGPDEKKHVFGDKASKESPRSGEGLFPAEGSGAQPEGTPPSSCKRRLSVRGEKAGNARSGSVTGAGPESEAAAEAATTLAKGRAQGAILGDPKARKETPVTPAPRAAEKTGTSWASVAAGVLKLSSFAAKAGGAPANASGPTAPAKGRTSAAAAPGEARPEDEEKKAEKADGAPKRPAGGGGKKEEKAAKEEAESRKTLQAPEKKDETPAPEKGQEAREKTEPEEADARKKPNGEDSKKGLLSPPGKAPTGDESADARPDVKATRAHDRGRRRSTQSVSEAPGGDAGPEEENSNATPEVTAAADGARDVGRRASTGTAASGRQEEKSQWGEGPFLGASFSDADAQAPGGAGAGEAGPLLRSGEVPKREGAARGKGAREGASGSAGPGQVASVFQASSHFPSLAVASYSGTRPPATASGIPTPPPLHASHASGSLPLPPYHHGLSEGSFPGRSGNMALPSRAAGPLGPGARPPSGPSRGPQSGTHASGSVANSACTSPAIHNCFPSSPYQVFNYGGPLPPSAALPSSFSVGSGAGPGGAASGTSSFSAFSPGIVGARPLAHMSSFVSAVAAQQPPLLPLPPSAYPQGAGRDLGSSWSPVLFFSSLTNKGASPETEAAPSASNAAHAGTCGAGASSAAPAGGGAGTETAGAQPAGTGPGEGRGGASLSGDGALDFGAGKGSAAGDRGEMESGKTATGVKAAVGAASLPFTTFPPLSFAASSGVDSKAATKARGDTTAAGPASAGACASGEPSDHREKAAAEQGGEGEAARREREDEEEFFDVPGLDDILGQMMPGVASGDSLSAGEASQAEASFFRPFSSFALRGDANPSHSRMAKSGDSDRKREDRASDGAPFATARSQSPVPRSSLCSLLQEHRDEARRNSQLNAFFPAAFSSSVFPAGAKDQLPTCANLGDHPHGRQGSLAGRVPREGPTDPARFDSFLGLYGRGDAGRDARREDASDRDGGFASSSPFFASLLAKRANGAAFEEQGEKALFAPALRAAGSGGPFAVRDSKPAGFGDLANLSLGEWRAAPFAEPLKGRDLSSAAKLSGAERERECAGLENQTGPEEGRPPILFPRGRKEEKALTATAFGEGESGARGADLRGPSASSSGSSGSLFSPDPSKNEGSVFRPFSASLVAGPRAGGSSFLSSLNRGETRGESLASSLSFLSRVSQRERYTYVPTATPFARGSYAPDGDSEMTFGPGVGVSPPLGDSGASVPLHGSHIGRERDTRGMGERLREDEGSAFAALGHHDPKRRAPQDDREADGRLPRPGQAPGASGGGYSGHQLLLHLQQQHAKILQARRSAAGLGQESLEAVGVSRPVERRREDEREEGARGLHKAQPSSFFPKLSEQWAGRGEGDGARAHATCLDRREETLSVLGERPQRGPTETSSDARRATAGRERTGFVAQLGGEGSEASPRLVPGAGAASNPRAKANNVENNSALAFLLSLLPNANVSIVGPDGSSSSTFSARSRNNSLATSAVPSAPQRSPPFASLSSGEAREAHEGEKPSSGASSVASSGASVGLSAPGAGVLGADPGALGGSRRVSEGGVERTEMEGLKDEKEKTKEESANASLPLSPSAFPPLSTSQACHKRASVGNLGSAASGVRMGAVATKAGESSTSGPVRGSGDSAALRRPASGGGSYPSSLGAGKRPGLLPAGRSQASGAAEKPSVFSAFSSFSSGSSFSSSFSMPSAFSPFGAGPSPHTFGARDEASKGEKKGDKGREKALSATLSAEEEKEKGDKGAGERPGSRRSSGLGVPDREKKREKARGEERQEGEQRERESEGGDTAEGKKDAKEEEEKRRENSPGSHRKKKEDRRFSEGSKNGALAHTNRSGPKDGRQRARHR